METLKDSIVTLTKEELRGIQIREDTRMNKQLELNLLQNERDMFWFSVMKKYNLDEKKVYDVSKDGVVTEKINTK
jgi:hypothetical protein